MCRHSSMLDESCCAICSGFLAKKQREYKNRKANTKSAIKRKYQAMSLQSAERHSEPIENWEIETFLENVGEEINYKELLGIALELQRSFNAMVWWHELMFYPFKFKRENSHAIDLIRRFNIFKERINDEQNKSKIS